MALKDKYLTVEQAAKELGVTRQTISRWIAKKYIPVERVGRVALIKKKDIQKYHMRRLTEAAADSVMALYLATAEDYVREKGYINIDKPTHAEFFDENDKSGTIYKLSDEDLAEVDNRVRPILMGMLKQLNETAIAVGKPPKKTQGGNKSK